jgi:hypothetical protein
MFGREGQLVAVLFSNPEAHLRSSSIGLVCLFASSLAHADTDPQTVATAVDPAPTAPGTTVSAPAPAPLPAPETGMRLRNGFSLSVGQEWGSGPSSEFSAQLFGADWRIGAQINDNIAAYLCTHLSMGNGKIGAAEGSTGNLAIAVIGEYTLPQRIFIGGGGGWGMLNNPSGALAQARVGWYPFEQHATGKVRRLNVAADARWYMPGDNIGTVTQLSLTVGYDRF